MLSLILHEPLVLHTWAISSVFSVYFILLISSALFSSLAILQLLKAAAPYWSDRSYNLVCLLADSHEIISHGWRLCCQILRDGMSNQHVRNVSVLILTRHMFTPYFCTRFRVCKDCRNACTHSKEGMARDMVERDVFPPFYSSCLFFLSLFFRNLPRFASVLSR